MSNYIWGDSSYLGGPAPVSYPLPPEGLTQDRLELLESLSDDSRWRQASTFP